MKISKLAFFLFVSILLTRCAEDDRLPTAYFYNSPYYYTACNSKLDVKYNIHLNGLDSGHFLLKLDGKTIHTFSFSRLHDDFSYSIAPSTMIRDIDSTSISLYYVDNKKEIEIQSVPIYLVAIGAEFSYYNRRNVSPNLVDLTEHLWESNEMLLPPGIYDVHPHNQFKTKTLADSIHYEFNYSVTLVEQETNKRYTFLPPISRVYTYALDFPFSLKEVNADKRMDALIGESADNIYMTYDNRDNQIDCRPGYQIYTANHDFKVTSRFLSCDTIELLSEEVIKVPTRYLFKCF